jgi:hypothetical protein
MAQRTTILLDDETREAARQLARRYRCSVSQAMRRAVIEQRDAVLGLPAARRRKRRQALERLFTLFAGHDAAREVRRLKTQDAGF